jgi:glc operon protein GlcG
MPFNASYRVPIFLSRPQTAFSAATAEAGRRGRAMSIAIVNLGGNLVAFGHMDGALLASFAVAEHEARISATYR